MVDFDEAAIRNVEGGEKKLPIGGDIDGWITLIAEEFGGVPEVERGEVGVGGD